MIRYTQIVILIKSMPLEIWSIKITGNAKDREDEKKNRIDVIECYWLLAKLLLSRQAIFQWFCSECTRLKCICSYNRNVYIYRKFSIESIYFQHIWCLFSKENRTYLNACWISESGKVRVSSVRTIECVALSV